MRRNRIPSAPDRGPETTLRRSKPKKGHSGGSTVGRQGSRLKLAALLLFFALQVVLPLRYYFFLQDSPVAHFDERFAWRMFSPTRMVACDGPVPGAGPQFWMGDRAIRLSSIFHQSWITLARRGRPKVIGRMGHYLCSRAGDEPVRLLVSCRMGDGSTLALSDGVKNLCKPTMEAR